MLNHNNHFHVQGARPTAVFRLMGFASELELEQRRGRGRFVRFQCEAGGAVAGDEPWWGAAAAGGGGNWRSRRVLGLLVGDVGQTGSVPCREGSAGVAAGFGAAAS